jgi:hypothetical protein
MQNALGGTVEIFILPRLKGPQEGSESYNPHAEGNRNE